MDIVYPVLQNGNNEELRYSLRSIDENFIFDRIFIVGHKPSWICNIEHIEYNDSIVPFGSYNTSKKLLQICENINISDDFVLMADDIYILEKVEKIGYYKKGSMKDYLDFLRNKGSLTQHGVVIEKTMRIISHKGDVGCFETHTPIVYNKNKMRDILLKYNLGDIAKRSIYCIENNVIPEDFITYNYLRSEILKDCKFYNIGNLVVEKGQQFLSSLDFNEEIQNFLQKKYPKPSRFEIIG